MMPGPGVLEIEGLEAGDAEAVRRAVAGARSRLKCGLVGAEVCGIGAKESRRLNRRYRGKNKAATVLSFSLPPLEPGGMAGQILLCIPAVRNEARRLGIPFARWLAELAVHGFLHTLGYRHDDGSARSLMFAHQKAVLNMDRGVR